MKFQAPKGCRDFFPEDMLIRSWIDSRWKAVSIRNGFVEYDGPIFESLDLYRVKSGDEIVSQLFHFEARGGKEFAIRPEMTPTLARMVAERAQSLSKPIKWFSVPRVCRAERPQRGRLREFFQWNIDVLGADDPLADAECVYVAIDFFREVGLNPDTMEMLLNSRAIVASLLAKAEIPDNLLTSVYAALDKRDKLPAAEFETMLTDLGLSAEQRQTLIEMGDAKGPDGFGKIESMLAGDEPGLAHCNHLREVFRLLESMGVGQYCRYDMSVVRGLAYYTGTVFEAFGKGGLRRAICGGGRYDRLLSDLGGPPMGGVGFATSDVVIQDVLTELNALPKFEIRTDFFVIDANKELFDDVLKLTARLREKNLAANFSYKRQGVGKQFKQATAANAKRVIIVEETTDSTNEVTVKDLVSGQQASVSFDKLLDDPFMPIGD